jgi:hypothetical protein
VVGAELVALETGAAEVAVVRVYNAVLFYEYAHRTHVNADTGRIASVRVNIDFKQDGCRQADFHGRSYGPGRQAAAERETARGLRCLVRQEYVPPWTGVPLCNRYPGGYIKISKWFFWDTGDPPEHPRMNARLPVQHAPAEIFPDYRSK